MRKQLNRHTGRRKSIRSHMLARLSETVFDIPPRTRSLLILIGVIGIVLAFMESLVGRQEQTIGIDKIIHFLGYGMLASVFVLALRPILFLPGLAGLAVMGVTIEVLQAHTGRSPAWADVYANMLGVAIGGVLGMIARGVYAYIRKELAVQNVKRNLIRFERGDRIWKEGDLLEDFYIIKTGTVQLSRNEDGAPKKLITLTVGDVLGTLGIVLEEPQYSTITALDRVTLYRMDFEQLMAEVGGQELPISTVLMDLSRKLKFAVEKLVKAGIDLE